LPIYLYRGGDGPTYVFNCHRKGRENIHSCQSTKLCETQLPYVLVPIICDQIHTYSIRGRGIYGFKYV